MADPYPAPDFDPSVMRPGDTLPLPVSGQPVTPPMPGTPPMPPTYQAVPPPAILPSVPEQVLAQIGEIAVTATTVRTPVSEFPLRGSRWLLTDQWSATQKTPQWAVVVAIAGAVIGFFCLAFFSLLFLLFLLAKETVYAGTVSVTVTNGPYQYDTRIPVSDQGQVQHLHNMVNYVRSLATV